MSNLSDSQIRQQALDPQRSFIVQAPAGSGKTGLLVYRILNLLTTVERPEQILAITFTNKAASEMRHRILDLLGKAEANESTSDEYEQQGIELAKQALVKDKQFGWRLLDMPHQLNILTIDAFCAKLIGYMPWLSRLGDKPHTTEQPEAHYQAAIEQLLMELTREGSAASKHLQTVMLELDYDYNKARNMFGAMLSKRDQWLRHLLQNNIQQLRPFLEQAWATVSQQLLQQLSDSLPTNIVEDLLECARFAGSRTTEKSNPYLKFCADLQQLPQADSTEIDKWLAIRTLLLTNDLKPRNRLDKNCGFPAGEQPEMKDKLKAVIENLQENTEFLENLKQLDIIPPARFTNEQWQQLLALEQVLKQLAAQLQLRFRAVSECDFSEVAQRANLALQEMNNPTDLGLRMDNNLRHILVDEFQDTSHSQLELLKKLVSGWQPNSPDCSLFMVGDPMQSIYRFREADVGLFLRIANSESANQVFPRLKIEALQLSENFRSSKPLVAWFNTVFSKSFPQKNQVLQGAICYAEAVTHREIANSVKPKCMPVLSNQQEAEQVVAQIQHARQQDNEQKIAILVRGRSHLADILPALKQAEIDYIGVDIQPLNQTQSVLDVLALCKALTRLDDKVSWLALLRGPWCGLSLASIKTLLPDVRLPVWQQLTSQAKQQQLEDEQARRLGRFIDIMDKALQQRQQVSLHDVCRWAWQQLGGEHTLLDASAEDIEVVFSLIQQLEQAGDLLSVNELDKALEGLYARSQSTAENPVIVSTIHNSKGLQYDTVILPGLGRGSGNDAREILMWAEKIDASGQSSLLLAPLETENNPNTHYYYLRKLEYQRASYETLRLLYVACTRAKRGLILIAAMNHNSKGELSKPRAGTLLSTVWEQLQDEFQIQQQPAEEQVAVIDQTLQRLPDDFQYHQKPSVNWQGKQNISLQEEETRSADDIEYEWATEMAQAVGIVLHDWLQFYSQELNTFKIDDAQKQRWRAEFKAMNLPDDRINIATKRMCIAIENMQQHDKAKWIFGNHQHQENEYALSTFENGIVKTWRIDRTFVDENNTRWIIDYKSTYHSTHNQDGDIKQFVDQQIEERHKAQLDNYGKLFAQIEDREIKLGVYFPLLKEWREWGYDE